MATRHDSDDWFVRMVQHRDAGRFDEALALLAHHAHSEDRRLRCIALGEMGGLYYFELKDPARAVEVLVNCTRLCPTAELPSLYLFHALVDLGRFDDAMAEAERFMRLRPSEEYRRLMREIAEPTDGSS